jgi:hypothetical protein
VNAFTIVAALGFLISQLASLTLVYLAFRTNGGLGMMVFFLPFYGITLGNHRIASPYARMLALVSWIGLAVFLVALVLMPR